MAGKVKFDSTGIIENIEMTYLEYKYSEDIDHWMEDCFYNYEDCDESEIELSKMMSEHSYATETHVKELIELIKERNNE
jgi:hypothetical protein